MAGYLRWNRSKLLAKAFSRLSAAALEHDDQFKICSQ
jgi:hypothetical protein